MAASVPQKLVGIIGAGIAGPAFALQLLSHPRLASLYRPLLLDKTPDPSTLSSEDQAKKESASFGAAVAVFPNGLHPLYALGLREAVESASLPLDIISFWKSPTASSTPHYEYGTIDHPTWSHGLQSDAINIERSALRDMLLKAARERGCETMWDKKIKGFEEQDKGATKINFEDGSDLTVDLLVGADGGYSMVRKYILDKRDPATAEKRWLPDFMHQTGFYGISKGFPYDKDVSSRATIGIWLDRGMLASAPVPGDKIRWDLVLPEKEAPPASRAVVDTPKSEGKFPWESAILPSAYSHDSSVEILQKHMNAFHPAAGTIGNLLENAEQIIRTPLRQRVWKAKEIQYGNVALIGDAARLMLPSSGQGTGFGIEDATVLAAKLLEHSKSSADQNDLRPALEAYARERVPRSKKMATVAWVTGKLAMADSWFWRWVRDFVSRWFPVGYNYKNDPKAKDPWPLDARFNVDR